MARETKEKCTRCRRAGEKLFLKGEKCFGPKCALMKRNFPPGVHGSSAKRAKHSVYGKQLAEKQKAKRMYGLLEKQFSNYVAEAAKKTGDTSMFLITNLESRLDNVVYKSGLGKSRNAARQMISHGHIQVNGKKVDIPSYRLKVGQVVSVCEASLAKKLFEKISEKLAKIELPGWMSVDAAKVSVKILNTATNDSPGFDAKSIIEFYSR